MHSESYVRQRASSVRPFSASGLRVVLERETLKSVGKGERIRGVCALETERGRWQSLTDGRKEGSRYRIF